jgi:hypothetical protein
MAAIFGSLTSADLETSASDVSTPTTGRIYANTSTHEAKVYLNAGWKTLFDTTTSQTATNKTFTSPVLNTGISGTAFLDEDDMASDSATKVASQQSIKAFVTSSVATGGVANVRASEGGGTVTLTTADSRDQVFNLSSAETVVLPTTSILKGDRWTLRNITTNVMTIQSSAGTALTIANSHNTLGTIRKGTITLVALQNTPTTPAHWQTVYLIENGTYTPTVAGDVATNVEAAVGESSYFSRDINIIKVAGSMTVNPTSGSTATTVLDVPLPIASNFTNSDTDAHGVGAGASTAGVYQAGHFDCSTTLDKVLYNFVANDAANRRHHFEFTYTIK